MSRERLSQHISKIADELTYELRLSDGGYHKIKEWIYKNFKMYGAIHTKDKAIEELYKDVYPEELILNRITHQLVNDIMKSDDIFVRTTDDDGVFIADRFETLVLRVPETKDEEDTK